MISEEVRNQRIGPDVSCKIWGGNVRIRRVLFLFTCFAIVAGMIGPISAGSASDESDRNLREGCLRATLRAIDMEIVIRSNMRPI
jgi:hypothetical protein